MMWAAFISTSSLLAALMAISTLTAIRRFLHIDGLIDTVDGFAAGWGDRARILEVMRVSSIGAFGAVSAFTIILIKAVSLADLRAYHPSFIAFIFPVIGLGSGAAIASRSAYARAEGGTGSVFIARQHWSFTLAIVTQMIAIGFLGNDARLLLAVVISLAAAAALAEAISKSIKGQTGDTLGGIIEISETVFLVVLARSVG